MNKSEIKIKLDNEIKIIITETVGILKNSIEAIILYGSYGRGEGAFYVDENNEIRTYNDFDIIIVSNSFINNSEIDRVTEVLSNKLDVRWIDISQKSVDDLKQLKSSIFNFDLKYGSTVIWGNKEILQYIPAFESNKLSLKEGETLYFTRIWTFLGSLPINAFKTGVSKNNARFFRNQMAKAVLAVVDILLLQNKSYNSSYKKRVELINELHPNNTTLINLANWALNEKLRPKSNKMSSIEVSELYGRVSNLFFNEMYQLLGKFYNRNIITTKDIEAAMKFSLHEIISIIKGAIQTRRISHSKGFKLRIAQSYIFESYFKKNEEKIKLINLAKKKITEIDSTVNIDSFNWNELRIFIAELRLNS
tara:strand:- start:1863 stop:2954 length:1092 start_codon:yes stop_codon:yes gene_type:complete